ncbi:MAG: hypothetical protein AB8H47_17380 [Bacteroidia bacterium]
MILRWTSAILFFVLLSGTTSHLPGEKKWFKETQFDKDKIAQLKTQFGDQKVLAEKYKLVSLIALSHYPELKEVPIEFVEQAIKTTMAARPDPASVFQRQGRRHYKVFINNSDDCQIHIDDISFNGQIGIIGHELAHILDYEQSSGPGIMGAGLNYATARTKAIFEKSIDRLTISRGLGWQLHEWSDFAINRSAASQKYKDFKADTYLQPEEILSEIDKLRSGS